MQQSKDETLKILFVCMGNICRSPAGEGLMQHLVNERSLSAKVLVDSAGTIGYHAGNPPDSRMKRAAGQRGYDLRGRARQVTRQDLDEFNLVVAMDRDNLSSLQAMANRPRCYLALLSDYLSDDWPTDVPDPYYGGDQGFEDVLDMIESACPTILERWQDGSLLGDED